MPQAIILKNLIKFVTITEKSFEKEIKKNLSEAKDAGERKKIEKQIQKHQAEFPIYFDDLKRKLKNGMCFGFSTTHAVMQDAGKLTWWEAALQLVADWKNESLDELISLPDSIEVSTRRKIFERVLNYICFTQTNFSSFSINDMDHADILKPSESKENYSLDYINTTPVPGSVSKAISKNTVIAGSFTVDQLEIILKNNLTENTICIVISKKHKHAIRFGMKNGEYIMYEPNDSHYPTYSRYYYFFSTFSKFKEIFKTFATLKDMLKELQGKLGLTIAFLISSFDQKEVFDTSYYEYLAWTTPELLIKAHGLHHIAQYYPALCNQIMLYASTRPILRKTIAEELVNKDEWNAFQLIGRYSENAMRSLLILAQENPSEDIFKILPRLIMEKNTNDCVGLHCITGYSIKAFPQLIKLAEDKSGSEIRKNIGLALLLKTKKGNTALGYIAHNNSDFLSSLFKLGKNDKNFCDNLAKALALQNTGFLKDAHVICNYPENALDQLIELAETKEGEKIYNELCHIIARQTSDGSSGFQKLASFAPQSLEKLIKLAESKPDKKLLHQIGIALPLKNIENWAAFNYIFGKNLNLLSPLFKLGVGNKSFCDNLAKVLALQSTGHTKDSHVIIHYPEDAFNQLIELAETKEGESIYNELCNTITQKSSSGCFGLYQLTNFARKLEKILQLAESKTDNKMLYQVGEALSLQYPGDLTGLHHIIMNAPSVITSLIKLCKQDENFSLQFDAAIKKSGSISNREIEEYVEYRAKEVINKMIFF